MEALAPDFVEDLFRFALVLSGRRLLAVDWVCLAVAELESRSDLRRGGDRDLNWAARRIWLAYRAKAGAGSGEGTHGGEIALPAEMECFLSRLAPQERACAALEWACEISESTLAAVFDEKIRSIQAWREGWTTVLEENGVGKSWRAWVKACCMDEFEKQRLVDALQRGVQGRPRFERFLGLAAVIAGALALVSWFVWERWHSEDGMSVQTALSQLLGTSSEWEGGDWKSFEGTSGEVVDWLFLNGFEGVRLPDLLGGGGAKAGRIVRWRDMPVAVVVSSASSLVCFVPAQAVFGREMEGPLSGKVNSEGWKGDWFLEESYFVVIAETFPVR